MASSETLASLQTKLERLKGLGTLQNPTLNKGTAFTDEERDVLGIRGFLPPRTLTMDQQLSRCYKMFSSRKTSLDKYLYLQGVCDRNETLFYRLVTENLTEMMPILYTPTVGQACQLYGRIFTRPRGLYISIEDKGRVAEILRNWPEDDIRVIVVTDGERILGLGDQGVHGMPIPIGKLMLYTLCGGMPPMHCLPVTIDVGTENEEFLKDEQYLGLQQHRVRGQEYDDFVDEFVMAVQARFPGCLIQFEDFDNRNAFRLLKKYQDRVCTFNDDIQGTSAVTLAALLASLRLTKKGGLKDNTFLFLGAGEAGIGIGDLVCAELVHHEGLTIEEAREKCYFIDSRGLVCKSRTDLQEHKKDFAHDTPPLKTLLECVKAIKPSVLVGVAAQASAFTKEVIEEMTAINERPVIFALSNPTSHAECTAEEAYKWSEGKAIFATGSPFDPVTIGEKTFITGQANNSWIFPAVGMAVLITGARKVTEDMFLASARSLAKEASEQDLATGCLFPDTARMREVEARVAAAVAENVWDSGFATKPRPADILATVQAAQYNPEYPTYS